MIYVVLVVYNIGFLDLFVSGINPELIWMVNHQPILEMFINVLGLSGPSRQDRKTIKCKFPNFGYVRKPKNHKLCIGIGSGTFCIFICNLVTFLLKKTQKGYRVTYEKMHNPKCTKCPQSGPT